MCPSFEHTSLWSVQLPLLLSLTLPSHPPIIQQLSVHIVIFTTCTDIMHFDIVDTLSFSFPFPAPLNSSTITNIFYI
jgi:hypothetical protein